MMHKPILIHDLTFSLGYKVCFEDINGSILSGSRIGIIGSNGCGKSSLLQILLGQLQPTSGKVTFPETCNIGFVPQTITDYNHLSGGQRFHKALSSALANNPDILLLDEPTNHLDAKNRNALKRMLAHFNGTLIIATHDIDLLNHVVDTIWHIDQTKLHVFNGQYSDYIHERKQKATSLFQEKNRLKQAKKNLHLSLMAEQQRAAKSRSKGKKSIQQRKWATITSHAKMNRASHTTGKNKAQLGQQREAIKEKLSQLDQPEAIKPTFKLEGNHIYNKNIVCIQAGKVSYQSNTPILENINFNLQGKARLAITGANGKGKSTFFKALLRDPAIIREGHWQTIELSHIGYLDQHYSSLAPEWTVYDVIAKQMPHATTRDIRFHLSDYLFRTNEAVNTLVKHLSGGEKARLSLAQIAASPPTLLLLDEVTNNIDLETKNHIITALNAYPGAMVVISHDNDFLESINIHDCCDINIFSGHL